MEKYMPDIYQKNIYQIDYEALRLRGIKCLLFDLDNTLVPYNSYEISKKLLNFIAELKEMNFKIIIFSNRSRHRVAPFKKALTLDACAKANKPFKSKFIKIMDKYKLQQAEVAIIGDQLLTDIAGGNKVGITTILVNPISLYDAFGTKILRFQEKSIIKQLEKNNLFKKGRYYE